MGVRVDLLGRGGEFFVDRGDLAGGGCEQIGDSLNRFDRAECLAGSDVGADFRQFDENDVSQRLLSVIGDADGGRTAIGFDPLVLFGVLPIRWISHIFLPSLWSRSFASLRISAPGSDARQTRRLAVCRVTHALFLFAAVSASDKR